MERSDWEKQHGLLMGQMDKIVGKDGYRIYYIDEPRLDVREVRPTVTVCIGRVQVPAGFEYFRGIAVCYPRDNPDKVKGRCYAMRRALRAFKSKDIVQGRFTDIGRTAFGENTEGKVTTCIETQKGPRWILGAYNVYPMDNERRMFNGKKEQAKA